MHSQEWLCYRFFNNRLGFRISGEPTSFRGGQFRPCEKTH